MNLRGIATTALIALVVTVAYQKYGAAGGMKRGA
jgi:hypothetical protein